MQTYNNVNKQKTNGKIANALVSSVCYLSQSRIVEGGMYVVKENWNRI